jgi:hypothetical protein
MGISVSILLIAVGAILTWGVTAQAEGLDINAIGVILMIVGLIGFLLTLMFWQSWLGRGGFRRREYVEGAAPVAAPRERRVVVEEEDVGGPPAAGPPPPEEGLAK